MRYTSLTIIKVNKGKMYIHAQLCPKSLFYLWKNLFALFHYMRKEPARILPFAIEIPTIKHTGGGNSEDGEVE